MHRYHKHMPCWHTSQLELTDILELWMICNWILLNVCGAAILKCGVQVRWNLQVRKPQQPSQKLSPSRLKITPSLPKCVQGWSHNPIHPLFDVHYGGNDTHIKEKGMNIDIDKVWRVSPRWIPLPGWQPARGEPAQLPLGRKCSSGFPSFILKRSLKQVKFNSKVPIIYQW